MSAEVFAIIGALAFAVNSIFTRRAVIKVVDAAIGVLITVPMGVPFFMLILIATGQTGSVVSFSWQSYAWLSAAGIVHFVVGRSLMYNCVKLVGANRAQVIVRVSPLVAVILGISVLNEPLTWELAVGVLLIVCGLIVIVLNPQMFRGGHGLLSGIPYKAFLFGIGTGLAWGISPIMVKLGLGASVSPVAGAFISYTAATLILGISLWNHNRRDSLVGMSGRAAGLFCLVGLLSNTAQLLKYIALSMAPASVVVPIFSISPVFLLVLSFMFNRKLEVFTPAVIMGTIAVVVGTILVL